VKVVKGSNLNNSSVFQGVVQNYCEDFFVTQGVNQTLHSDLSSLSKDLSNWEVQLGLVRTELSNVFASTSLVDAENHADKAIEILRRVNESYDRDLLPGVISDYENDNSSRILGGCNLPVQINGQNNDVVTHHVVCPIGEMYQKCKEAMPLAHRLSFEGTLIGGDGNGKYLPREIKLRRIK
jgi:hypothetical protein